MREKSVQISEKLFVNMAKYFILECRDKDLEKRITEGLSEKLEAILRHDLYTKYKTAPTSEQQEQARIEYLKKAKILPDFQW